MAIIESYAWGAAPTLKIRREQRLQRKLSQQPDKVFNPKTKSWVDKHDFEVAMTPDTRNPNIPEGSKNQNKLTQTLSKNQKLSSMNQYEKTEVFEHKVNFSNEKQSQRIRE